MRTLRWMSGSTLNDQIKNKNIWCKLEVAPFEHEMRKTHLRWFGHI